MSTTAPQGEPSPSPPRHHVLGLAWVLAAAGALVAPALAHGSSLGPIDWLSQYGLSHQHGVVVHNHQVFDQVTEMIPWSVLGWTQVHAGHLPLWNPYSGLGMPLAFNWQAASFSVPALAGYLAPVHLAYTVQVLVVLVIAGTGTYVLSRMLGLGVLGCAMAATVFELSGPFVGWLGWPVAWVMAWSGWVFAAALAVLRGRRRARAVALFALALAATVYAGQPDTVVLVGLALVSYVVGAFVLRAGLGAPGPVRRPLLDLVVGSAAGAALSAPLLLPGLQLASVSVRAGKGQSQALAASDLIHVVVAGFDGSPVAGSVWFGPSFFMRTAAYVGVVGIALAVVGGLRAVRSRRHEPDAAPFVLVAVASAAVAFVPLVMSALVALPAIGPIAWNRALLPMAFALAVLAGVGVDDLARRHDRLSRRAARIAFAALGAVLLLVWGVGRGHPPPVEAAIRNHSLRWPALAALAGVAVVSVPVARRRGRRARSSWWMGGVLLAVETALLVGAGAPLLSSSSTPLAPTPAEAQLARLVGDSLVGFGNNACFTGDQVGIVPDVNVAFGISEMGIYDPVLPKAYGASWTGATGVSGGPVVAPAVPFSLFCPEIDSARVARRYGVAFVLEARGAPGPAGTTRVATVGGEGLYQVPDVARATVVAASGPGWPGLDASGAAGGGHPPRPGHVADGHRQPHPGGAAPPAHQRPRLARHRGRATLGPGALRRRHAPDQGAGRAARGGGPVPAGPFHPGPGPGRRERGRPRRRRGVREPAAPPSPVGHPGGLSEPRSTGSSTRPWRGTHHSRGTL